MMLCFGSRKGRWSSSLMAMRPSFVILPLATLFLGIGIGWFARPMLGEPPLNGIEGAAMPAKDKPEASTAPSKEQRPAKTERERPAKAKADTEPPPAVREMVTKMHDQMIGRHRDSLEQHLAALQEALQLNPEQQEKMKGSIEKQISQLKALMGESKETPSTDAMRSIGPEALDESIASSLSPEQQSAMTAFKERQKARQADAQALKDLSKLQGIMEFKEGQRDEVYRIFSESAAEALNHPDPMADFAQMTSSGVQVDMDPYGLGLQKLLTDTMKEGGPDNKEAVLKFHAAADRKIEEKVEKLRPVLDEAQLERYRAELKAKGLGVYSSIIPPRE